MEGKLSIWSASIYKKRQEQLKRVGEKNLNYPKHKYLSEEQPPGMMFIPSDTMMLKLIMIAWIIDS